MIHGTTKSRFADDEREQLAFLVPGARDGAHVLRFVVYDETEHAAPLSVYAGWWFCATEGRVVSLPSEDQYGVIQARDFEIDQTNGERGME